MPQAASDLAPKAPPHRITVIAKKAFELIQQALYYTALVLAKLVILPILFCATTLATLSLCVGELFQLFVLPHLESIHDELIRVIIIAAKFGFGRRDEVLQKADSDPKSPEYILIRPKQERKEALPILIAPGYLDEAETLRDLGRRLADGSGCPVILAKYYNRLKPIPALSHDLERIAKVVKHDGIITIGHSMGGLTTTGWILEKRPKVKLRITIGTPHYGTVMAHFGILGECGKEMRPNSHYLQKLHTEEAVNLLREIPSLHIYSATDHVVPYLGKLPHGEQYRCNRNVGHLGVREEEDVIQKLLDAINKAHLT